MYFNLNKNGNVYALAQTRPKINIKGFGKTFLTDM